MGVGAFLLALVQPILSRILIALGFSVVTFVGMDLVIQQLVDYAVSAWGDLPGNILALAGLAGVGEALSIIMGAVLTRLLIWQLTKSVKLMGVNT